MNQFLRPKATILPESAVIPDENLIRPPPTRFTHEVKAEQSYYYDFPGRASAPDGSFLAGTKVVLMSSSHRHFCQVVDGRGLHVATAFDGLRPID